ncbi:ATP-binding cassette domain-containing protein [Egibacter rhizosphaerae]|uniref:ATP-binding cassette domain-containing protein n=1 Tax=Egibacter rhizosphaerae TaxID=1670831 RepID=A0A411YB72_9ACTN|nr:ATP-binding cassette domain-containing protein [Egibacter rhizosphaerae]QBI18454.1 ATP-binding cassette domain-containing protein [Egibacter rhizosphaerae]
MPIAPNPPAIAATGLCKSYGDHLVLDGIDLHVAEGTVSALLGPNGAGKTTIVNILSTLVGADQGHVEVFGHDLTAEPDEVRAAIGLTGQFSAVDEVFTGRENLRLMADLHHLPRDAGRRRVAGLLERFDLVDAADTPVHTYSGGMRRRLDLAMTLVGRPRLIFLDEPTTGLDPRSRRGLWEIVRELVADGVTVFLTTQYMEEADQLADRIVVLDRGTVVAEGSPDELKRRLPGGHVQLEFANVDDLEAAATRLDAAVRDEAALALRVPGDGSLQTLRGLLHELDAAAVDVASWSVHHPDLDDVFLTLTGHPTATAGSEPASAAPTTENES